MSTRAHSVPRFYLREFADQPPDDRHEAFLFVGQVSTGDIKRRSPRNLSIARGLYDGPRKFSGDSLESHLARIESAAAPHIRKLASGQSSRLTEEICRFISWQAARTPGWMRLAADWAADWDPSEEPDFVEPPPEGFERMTGRDRPIPLHLPSTGETREAASLDEFKRMHKEGWRWKLCKDDELEMVHLQAWYLHVRHFARLSWVRLHAPQGTTFVTSDRAVTWLADGYANAPPSILRLSSAQVVAPLTRSLALVGRHETDRLNVTPREINRFVACTATEWIAGPSEDAVRQALEDRAAAYAGTSI